MIKKNKSKDTIFTKLKNYYKNRSLHRIVQFVDNPKHYTLNMES